MLYNVFYSAKDSGGGGAPPPGGQNEGGDKGGGNAADNNVAGGDSAQGGEGEQPDALAAVDKLIEGVLQRQKAEFETLIENERKKAGMDDEQRATFEREQRLAALDAREAALALKELRADTAKLLSDKDLPQDFLDYIIGADIKDTMQRLDNFKPLFDKAVQAQVEKRLAGKTPERGSGVADTGQTTREEIRSILKG